MNKIISGCTAIIMVLVFSSCTGRKAVFTNPLLPSGADPWSIYKDGNYYYTQTLGNRLVIWKTASLSTLAKAEQKTVFQPGPGLPYSRGIWAPEIHNLDGKWYLYFAADNGKNENHRLYVLENTSPDPMQGQWTLKGKLTDETDKWAIDGSVFSHNGLLYLVWSGWAGDKNGQQDIYISRLKNPWTIEGKRVRISSPRYEWERHGTLNDSLNPPHVAVNEGPQYLAGRDKIILVYSASGCWTDNYSLGMLWTSNTSDPMDSASWHKNPEPVFKASPQNGVYAPGHNSFFKSPDGKQDWILYHANSAPGQGCGRARSPRAQPFTWTKEGLPFFGEPVKTGIKMKAPSGSPREKRSEKIKTT